MILSASLLVLACETAAPVATAPAPVVAAAAPAAAPALKRDFYIQIK
jgi:hypothetical protein